MKLNLFDAYNIRARFSASIIMLAPIAITLFFLFDDMCSLATSTVILFVLLAFSNYVPTLQHLLIKKKALSTNYAEEMLSLKDSTFDEKTKKRYFTKLASFDESLSYFNTPDDSEAFYQCCESAVIYLRNNTRDNKLVQEENINFGFCKNLLANKLAGIIICIICCLGIVTYSFLRYGYLGMIPLNNYLAIISDFLILLFWIFGVNAKILSIAGKRYAKALVMAIDSLNK